MVAEILSVGTEILLGQIDDSNATYLSEALAGLGIDVYRRSAVGDNFDRVVAAIREARGRSDLVIITGGIGPTDDDVTREAVAAALGRELVEDADALRNVEHRYSAYGLPMTERSRKQARVPRGAQAIPNPRGTAAGIFFEDEVGVVVAMPGVPSEMTTMYQEYVSPRLAEKSAGTLVLRELHLVGIGESRVQEMVAETFEGSNPTVAPLAKPGEVALRIAAKAATAQEAEKMIEPVERALREQLGDYIFGQDGTSLEEAVGELLKQRRETVAAAESCTGGWLGKRITDVAGSSDYFLGSLTCYSNEAKAAMLGVSASTLEEKGAVSADTAEAMAAGVRCKLGSDWGIGITGIAGPSGGTDDKPVGLVYIGLAGPRECQVATNRFPGSREDVRWRSTQKALEMLWRTLRSAEDDDCRKDDS
jgi:nicotinamide-nucleotide amidase